MPERKTLRRAREKRREGKAPSTQASEFVREQMHKLEEGKGPRSRRQAIAIGLSEARQEGIPIPSRRAKGARSRPKKGTRSAQQDRTGARKSSRPKRSASKASATQRTQRSRTRRTAPRSA